MMSWYNIPSLGDTDDRWSKWIVLAILIVTGVFFGHWL